MFIQAQDLPWSKGLPKGGWDDLEIKVLSVDEATGACSTIVRYPAGWDRTGGRYLTCHEEFLVL